MASVSESTVHSLLRNLKSVDAARELFAELNYGYENSPIPMRNWPSAAQEALAEDPRIIAGHGEFRIIYARQKETWLKRTDQRPVMDQLLRDFPYGVYIFSDNDGSDWQLINVKQDEETGGKRIYRRFEVGQDERTSGRLRTISEQLAEVELRDHELDYLETRPLEIQSRYDKAFDVEAVTRRFYREYRALFEKVEREIDGYFDGDGEARRLFTQRLFNRLMFIEFIQKKGWLQVPGQEGNDYLSAIWQIYRRQRDSDSNFYRDRLEILFFDLLDTPHGNRRRTGPLFEQWFGDPPYLDGGLFQVDEGDRREQVPVPDECIDEIITGLFDRFNFTVTESTPTDLEVAVDPEMLGKVFEELVTGRHETGSYYTPKPVVSFMAQEGLKGYLKQELDRENPETIDAFVELHDPSSLRNPEVVLAALQRVRVCDPACGSGAYLLGVLHELLSLREVLFNVVSDPVTTYERKLQIIENNIYGVDIDVFAVNIARLRLWLSLAVDYDGPQPQPLPNLDFKIEVGDSLLGPAPVKSTQDDARSFQIRRFAELKHQYMRAESQMKTELERQIKDARDQIAAWTHGGAEIKGFDWAVEFAEVFQPGDRPGGFDIVLANPPYVRHELIGDVKPELQRVYGPLHTGTADLYVYFYIRGFQLLRSGGVLSYISSNKWFRAGYGKKLRAWIAENATVDSITDFGDLPVFESATAYPMIFIASLDENNTETRFTEVDSLNPPYPDVREVIQQQGNVLPPSAIDGEDWMLTDEETAWKIDVMKRAGTTLGEYVDGKIYYGIKTGFNKAFVIDGTKRSELIAADPRSEEVIRPFIVGRDIKKWHVDYKDRWLIFTRRGIDINRYPAIEEHLSQWKRDLTPKPKGAPKDAPGRKPGSYKWYEIQDSIDYHEEFEKPKIIYPVIGKSPLFSLDRRSSFSNDKTYIIPISDFYLLAVLNSSPAWLWVMNKCSLLQGGFWELRSSHLSQLPVPRAEPTEIETISELVEKCLEGIASSSHKSDVETELNSRVTRLYGLYEKE